MCSVSLLTRSAIDAELSNVFAMDVDSRGLIYTISASTVTVFAPDGSLLRRFGRDGAGPGEFKNLIGIQILPGDSVFTFDTGLSRITVFAPGTDSVAYTLNLLTAAHKLPPSRLVAVPDKRIFLAIHQRVASARGATQGQQVVRILNWDGTVRRDSVLSFPASGSVLIARGNGVVTAGYNPFGAPHVVKFTANGHIYYGPGDSLSIEVYDLEGQRDRAFSSPYTPPRVTGEDIEHAVKEQSADELLSRALRAEAPERWPAYHNFVVDDAGQIWVGLTSPNGEPIRWAVFSRTGERLCSVTFPETVGPEVIRDNRVYGVARDTLDVPSVVVYRVSQRRNEATR